MSAVAELVRKITGRKLEQRAIAYDSYRDLVRAALRGESLDEDGAERILESAGKTPHDLEVDVARAQLRQQKRAEADELPALQAEIKKCDAVIDAATQKYRAAKAEFARVREEQEPKKAALTDQIFKRSAYLDDLFNSCDDPKITQRRQAIARELSELHGTQKEIDAHLKVSTVSSTLGSALQAAKQRVADLRQRTTQLERTGGSFYHDAKTELEKAEAALTALENGPVKVLRQRQAAVESRRAELEIESRDLYQRACEI
jgi:hypothetical protein